ncbi:hypothetical protein OMK64_01680 [Cellulomonas fimi]|uniref:hypothetical protein n=1 Tax=Cellulomonas fimi TaxID=1708 RepID=UPI00234C7204|nr:hypothetical protein [Cellulomonas fimi]MDC7120242.1 hypothetical protein [Cellulomonas fimi]
MTIQPTPNDYGTLARGLVEQAPDGWRELIYIHQSVGDAFTDTLICDGPNGQARLEPPPSDDFLDLLLELRSRMYRPGLGAWYTATIRVTPDGRITADFDYDHEPTYEFAPDSWRRDAERFPRTPENTPDWLAAKAQPAGWLGARWQIDLTPGGVDRDPSRPLDATTTAEAREWSTLIAARLRAGGHGVERGADVGRDPEGNEVQYDELVVDVGEGYMALAFWRDLIFWSADVFADQVDEATFIATARAVLTSVREVTGYAPSVPLAPYEQRLLGFAA